MTVSKNWIGMIFLLQLFLFSEAAWSLSQADKCQTYLGDKDYDNAIKCFTYRIESIKSGKDLSGRGLSGAYTSRGLAWYRKKDFDRAIADYDQVIKLDPGDFQAYTNRGLAWFWKKDYDRAVTDFTRVIELIPQYDGAYYNRGLAWFWKKDYDRAIADYDQVIKLNPRDGQAYTNRGLARCRKKDYDRAIADYNRALEILPGDALTYNARGDLFFLQGRFIQASENYKASLTKNPQDRYTAIWLFLALERAGKNGRPELNNRRGNLNLTEWPETVIQFYSGKSSSGEVVRSAKKERENLCGAYFFLGQHFLIKGDKKKAMKMFQLCLKAGNSGFREYIAAQEELNRLK